MADLTIAAAFPLPAWASEEECSRGQWTDTSRGTPLSAPARTRTGIRVPRRPTAGEHERRNLAIESGPWHRAHPTSGRRSASAHSCVPEPKSARTRCPAPQTRYVTAPERVERARRQAASGHASAARSTRERFPCAASAWRGRSADACNGVTRATERSCWSARWERRARTPNSAGARSYPADATLGAERSASL